MGRQVIYFARKDSKWKKGLSTPRSLPRGVRGALRFGRGNPRPETTENLICDSLAANLGYCVFSAFQNSMAVIGGIQSLVLVR